MWDPGTYLRFSDERSRPFFDLLARVGARDPETVVDLGCGPGHLTRYLRQRWPSATVRGLDNSAEMIDAAREREQDQAVRFEVADVRDWHPTPDVGVVVCNAVLHWVPGHPELMARWLTELRGGAWLAVQVPGNFTSPAYAAIRSVAERRGLGELVPGADTVLDAVGYAELLGDADAWETTYIHQLPAQGGDHPVLRWFEGTGLRAIRSTVDDEAWAGFRADLNPLLEAAYPIRDGRVFFPFRRIFVVAHS